MSIYTTLSQTLPGVVRYSGPMDPIPQVLNNAWSTVDDTAESIAKFVAQSIHAGVLWTASAPEYLVESLMFLVAPITDPLLVTLDEFDERHETLGHSLGAGRSGREYIIYSNRAESNSPTMGSPLEYRFLLNELGGNTLATSVLGIFENFLSHLQTLAGPVVVT